ncbi:MAG: imidazole glycerol phosphate synthase subunit HisH [Gammaproteobacteria bacterium]|nr:imidazole glycerol phosphate synthase subunit HisH [Gammaproteobacteria bacterium]
MPKNSIAIVNAGGSNISSLTFALDRIKASYITTNQIAQIEDSSHVILPGVGAANDAMDKLKKSNLIEVVRNLKQPTLGICLGMQLLLDHSMENNVNCLSIIEGRCKAFSQQDKCPVPHMGWNNVNFNKASPLTEDLDNDDYFYFVHSYYAPITNSSIGITDYSESFASIIQKDNFYGTQFHPEKSSDQGSKLLRTFINL